MYSTYAVIFGKLNVTRFQEGWREALKVEGKWKVSHSTSGGAHCSCTSCQVFPLSMEYCSFTRESEPPLLPLLLPPQPILMSNCTTVAPVACKSQVSAYLEPKGRWEERIGVITYCPYIEKSNIKTSQYNRVFFIDFFSSFFLSFPPSLLPSFFPSLLLPIYKIE